MFAIGDKEWPGLSKLVEEAGETLQIAGKLMGSRGAVNHWSGDLREKLIEELGDLVASVSFFIENNMTDTEMDQFIDRIEVKSKIFKEWQKNDPALPNN